MQQCIGTFLSGNEFSSVTIVTEETAAFCYALEDGGVSSRPAI
ncbi:hypothetical protein HMPREF1985_00572 [Mitsuokella sp. oral taxon 131 str. W9106]|nr:hypothetical protein HMPREF1985_00572 [Mitsuokella sp. oral taxon 131 str. W9106]